MVIRVFVSFYSTISNRYREAAQKRYRPALAKLLGEISSSILEMGCEFVRKSTRLFAHHRDRLVQPCRGVTLSNCLGSPSRFVVLPQPKGPARDSRASTILGGD